MRQSRLLELLEDHFTPVGLQRALGTRLDAIPSELWETGLLGPLRDFLARPGKSVRARIVEAAWRVSGAPGSPPDLLPATIEVLHAGSLVIDDIEDEAVERRGRPALHLLYGVPKALNAGNWLYFWSELLLEQLGLDPTRELMARRWLTRTILSCHHGQALDIAARVTDIRQSQVPGVVSVVTTLKTGSLMALAMQLGALAARATPEGARALASIGAQLGAGLQMSDDLGSIVNDQRWDKGREDLSAARPTWPWAWLAAELDDLSFTCLRDQARAVLAAEMSACELAAAMRHHLGSKGRVHIDAHLASVLCSLRANVSDALLLDDFQMTLELLRAGYG
jgi:geranylgeranyl pyrophosphate synthase